MMHLDAPMGMRPDEPEPAPCDDSTTLHSAGQEDALHFKEQKAIITEVIMQSSNGSGKRPPKRGRMDVRGECVFKHAYRHS